VPSPVARPLSPRWIFLALALPTVASAQTGAPGLDPQKPISQYLHDIWTIDQGLPQNGVLAIAQGRDGYLWLGTEAGLVRFDGVTFTTFTTANTSGLKDDYVSAVMVDSSGDVLVGTWVGGVSRLGAGTSAAIPGAEGAFVNGVYRDRAGRLWVARTGGLALLRDGAFQPAAGTQGSVFSLAEDSSGLLLAGTREGLVTWRGDRFVPWHPPGGKGIAGAVWTVYHDRADGWWFGTPDALYHSRGARLERFDAAAGLPPGGVTSILESRNGELWVGTDGGGLARLVHRRFQRFAAQDGLSDDAVTALLEDREGSLWVGTRHGGLNRFRQPIFTLYTPREGLSASVVWSVYGDRQGALWIGTELSGLDRLQHGRFTNTMPGKSVVATLQTRDGLLWAATSGGLARLRGGRWEPMRFPGPHPLPKVSALTQDRTGALWLGGDDGLFRWDGRALRDYTEQAGLGTAKVRTIVEDGDGVLWIGTHGRGLVRLQNGRFTAWTTKEGLSNDVVESLFADEHGLWVGTESGLNLVRGGPEGGRITVLPLKFDVLMTDLFEILKDDGGHLWLSSNQGLARVSQPDLLAAADGTGDSVLAQEMVSLDGRRRIEFNGTSQNAGWKSPDGRLWFPSIKGLVVVDPARLTSNPLPPPVHIERIVVDGRALPLTDSVSVPPGGGMLELHYTATSLLVPERVRFRYRLEGYDRSWVEAGARRVAYYTRVPGGRYRFHVQAANNDGVWNESGAALPFRLGLHLYETWWFYGLIGLAVVAAFLGIIRLRVRAIQQRAEHLTQVVTERTSELQREVAERSRAEERYRHLFDSNPQPVWVSDRETLAFLAVNDAATRHYGYSRDEFSTMRLPDLQQPDQGAALAEWIRAAGDGWRGTSTWHHRKKDGTAIQVEVAARAFIYAGRPAALIVAADITARRDLEDRLRQAQKMEAVGQLAGGIAHDLNNVLTAVMAHVDLAVTSLPPDNDLRDDLTQAQGAARRGATMIAKLLGFSRRERLVLTPLRLDALVAEIAPTVRRMLPKIDVVVSSADGLQPVAADAGAVQRILLNVATNAADAMPEGGRLTIHLEPATPDEKQMAVQEWGVPGHYVVLSVTDNGCGMTPETLARIFEPYFTTKPADRGSGLGMAMVYGLMKQHLGYVLVNSTLGAGTEVRLYFPVSAHAVETASPEARPVRSHERQTILVVEDQEAVRGAATRGLTRFGYTVLAAADGEEGLRVWHDHAETIDLVVSDIIMPRMGGLALYAAVSRERAGVRFLLTSGFTGEEALQHTAATRALPFLPKPWTLHELLAAVRGVLHPG
jgi:PAS domain S-box-containing protein